MKNSINNLKGLLLPSEKLSCADLCNLKGGAGGEDIRRTTTKTGG